ncbi:MAG: hypothetical protein LN416_07050 [Candidatus Thermoplasmatota archaeon]|nr:hypothetical protein [Candidatus Thermoplasmatota archaeon]
MNPEDAVGKRVQLEILLKWDLKFSEGTIIRVEIHPETSFVHYLVELDSPLAFEPHERRRFWGRKRFPEIVTRSYVEVQIRRPEALEEELNGHVFSEFSAPLLQAARSEEVLDKPKEEIELGDRYMLGPGRIRLIE